MYRNIMGKVRRCVYISCISLFLMIIDYYWPINTHHLILSSIHSESDVQSFIKCNWYMLIGKTKVELEGTGNLGNSRSGNGWIIQGDGK